MTETRINIKENDIARYTDDHFMNKFNEEMEKIRQSNHLNNSPVSMSNPSSDTEEEDGEGDPEYFETDVLLLSSSNNLTFQHFLVQLISYQFYLFPESLV